MQHVLTTARCMANASSSGPHRAVIPLVLDLILDLTNTSFQYILTACIHRDGVCSLRRFYPVVVSVTTHILSCPVNSAPLLRTFAVISIRFQDLCQSLESVLDPTLNSLTIRLPNEGFARTRRPRATHPELITIDL